MLKLVTENQLDGWVRGNSRTAQELVVELVWRLVVVASPNPKERRFPLGDSIGQHGPDGVLNTSVGFEPFIPNGLSYWEIGTGLDAQSKATSDYKKLTEVTPESIRHNATFIFVTPLSARKAWEYSWKKEAQAQWVEERRTNGEWKDVRIIDGTKLIEWLHHFPAVEIWLATHILNMEAGKLGIEIPEQRWQLISKAGNPSLTPKIFLLKREKARNKMKELLFDNLQRLSFATHFPNEVLDFVAAYLASLNEEKQLEVAGRCLIVKEVDIWEIIVSHYKGMILVADPHLDLHSEEGSELLQRALQAGHKVITAIPHGGILNPSNQVPLPSPSIFQLQESLKEIGYSSERARRLAQKSGGNLGTLVKLIQDLPLIPSWAQKSDATDLALAMLVGAWDEKNEADRKIVEELTGEPYERWIKKLLDIAPWPGVPLIHRNGKWKFISRYETWYALGPKIFDYHLERLKKIAVRVLEEKDPQFDLPREERYAASIYGKVFTYSSHLRQGLAETLALLGSHSKALINCSQEEAESVAILTVRELLSGADWIRWASLDDVLPLLAEAAPTEVLIMVEKALSTNPCPFDEVFVQESEGIFGHNYITGLLWALETLAWSPDYLVRAVVCLGKLASRDPGGQWANRPIKSLTTILLPWFPQTCASVEKRVVAVNTLLKEIPEIGWKLLLSLLPQPHSVSFGSRKPAWREIIPEDWTERATQSEYWEQVERYSKLALVVAKNSPSKLGDLIERFENFPPAIQQELLEYLVAEEAQTLPEHEKVYLWEKLIALIAKHRRSAGAQWALPAERINELEAIARRLVPQDPALRHRRLFIEREFELFETSGNYESQEKELQRQRQEAVKEIEAKGGLRSVIEFSSSVENPWKVGFALGAVAENEIDKKILPVLLDNKDLHRFVDGYVVGRFYKRQWQWVDSIDTTGWTPEQIAKFLCLLPFMPETWERVEQLLGDNEFLYWTQVAVNPYQADKGLKIAVGKLLKYGKPIAACKCIARSLHLGQSIDSDTTIKALLDALNSKEEINTMDVYEICEIIEILQNDPNVKPEALIRVELAYLPLLDGHHGVTPKTLEHALARDPNFFCEVIRAVFPFNRDDHSVGKTEERKNIAVNVLRLFHQWHTPPGIRKNGIFDAQVFQTWIKEMRNVCEKTGHLKIAMEMVGQVLIHAPEAPDGLWIHHVVAEVLNKEDAENMRIGFYTAWINSRGVHWVDPTGKPERELAEKYRKMAEEVESRGYHRLAATMRNLAGTYEREAERIVSEEWED